MPRLRLKLDPTFARDLAGSPLRHHPNRLAHALLFSGVSSSDCAARTGVPVSRLSQLKKSRGPALSESECRALCRFFGVPAAVLFPATNTLRAA